MEKNNNRFGWIKIKTYTYYMYGELEINKKIFLTQVSKVAPTNFKYNLLFNSWFFLIRFHNESDLGLLDATHVFWQLG